jgi:phosphoserine phosphatase RsbU/P
MSPRGFRSLTTRLIAWTLPAVAGVYLTTVVVSNTMGRRAAIAAAEREAVNEAEAVVNLVGDLLHAVEGRTVALAEAIETLQPGAEGMDRLLRRFVAGQADVFGAAIAFEPRALRGGRERHALYYYRDTNRPDALRAADLASDTYRYWERDWYTEPVRTGEPRWSEPYRDVGGGEVAMVTYSVPLRAPPGEIRGVVTADLSLSWLDLLIREVRLGQSGFGLVLSRGRHVIADSRRETIAASERVLESAPPELRARFEPVVERIVAGASGFEPVEVEGRRYRLTYRPVGHAGWSLAALYPEDELLAELRRLRLVQAALSLVGLAVLGLVVVALSRRFTRPLGALAASAGRMATGDLDAALPPVDSRDEVGTLTEAFHHMRDSLKTHIKDLQETTAAKERFEGELRVARRIQADMLPEGTAGGPGEGYELAATLVPARAVGGDLFDHFREGRKVFFLVGDVSGKGVPAALFMARTKTVFEAVAAREGDPGAVLAAVNHNLCADNEAGMFVTAVCGVLELGSGEVAFALAGHDPPVLVPGEGDPAALQVEGGRVLGLIDGSDYPVNRLRLGRDEAVILYTDGVSEAQDAGEGFFGLERILESACRHRNEDARALGEGLLAEVRAFAGPAPQSDDITLMVVRHDPVARSPG